MRKLIAISPISLDGVLQARGELQAVIALTTDGLDHIWLRILGAKINQEMSMLFDLLIERTTFDIWSQYWPHHKDI